MKKNYSDTPVIRDKNMPSIFLAGPTERIGITKWRIEACKMLEYIDFEGIIYIPEYQNELFKDSDREHQALWEREALEHCDCILFWVARRLKTNMPAMPAFTTNVEFGTYLQRKPNQVVYGHPKSADKIWYLDWLYRYEKGPDANIYLYLKDAINKAVDVANWHYKTAVIGGK